MRGKILFMLLCSVLALMCVKNSDAAAPVKKWRYSNNNGVSPSDYIYSDAAAACIAKADLWPKNTGYEYRPGVVKNGNQCWLPYRQLPNGTWADMQVGVLNPEPVGTCPNGGVPDTTKPLDQQCPDVVTCADGVEHTQNVTSGWKTGPDWAAPWAKKTIPDGGWSAQRYCRGMCVITPSGPPTISNQNQTPSANGYYRVHSDGTFKQTGESCTQNADNGAPGENTEPTDPPPEKNRCPLGTKQTGIDSSGIPICTGDKPDTDPKKKTTTTKTTNADGSTTETTTEETTNSDGSKTTKTTTKTTNANGSAGETNETTTTGNKPDGSKGKSDSADKDKSDLCKQNPTLNICKNSQVSGQCQNVSCEGDAITCAIYRLQQKQYCEDREETELVKLGRRLLSGDDPQNGSLPSVENSTVINIPTQLNQTGFMGGGQCFPDKTFQVSQFSVVIPFSQACQYLIAFRYLVMLMAAIASFRIISLAFFK